MYCLTNKDITFLKAYKRLRTYVTETIKGVQFARLRYYQDVARTVLQIATLTDELAKKRPGGIPGRKYRDDDGYKRKTIADIIQDTDQDLLGMLDVENLTDKKERICIIFANMVLGREDDAVQALVDELHGMFPR